MCVSKCSTNRCYVHLYREDNDEETPQNVEQPAVSDNTADKAASDVNSEADVLINELTTQLKIHRSEIAQLQSKLAEMETKTACSSRQCVAFETVSKNDKLVAHLTGLPTAGVFNIVLELCQRFDIEYYLGWRVETISPTDQLFITLRKLRTNVSIKVLAWEYKVSDTTITNIVVTWLHVLWEILVHGMMNKLPSRQRNAQCLPQSFATFTNCRAVVDCTEIRCSIPKQFAMQSMTYSHYKHYHTLKGLVAVAPNAVHMCQNYIPAQRLTRQSCSTVAS